MRYKPQVLLGPILCLCMYVDSDFRRRVVVAALVFGYRTAGHTLHSKGFPNLPQTQDLLNGNDNV